MLLVIFFNSLEERVEKQKAVTLVTIFHVTTRTACEERSWMETWFCISQWPSVYDGSFLQAILIKPSGFSCIMTSIQGGGITNLPPFPYSTMLPRDIREGAFKCSTASMFLRVIHSNFKVENVCMQSTHPLTLTGRRWAKCAASFYVIFINSLGAKKLKH